MAPVRAAEFQAAAVEAESAEVVAARIASWLLEGFVQQADGPQAGAIAGWIGADRRAEYVYPEITGYFLYWLAWLAQRNGRQPMYVARAEAAIAWLTRLLDEERPPTRVYLDGAREDWRNRALFTFDLAMVLRGIAAATRAGLIPSSALVINRTYSALSQLIGEDGQFDACLHDRHSVNFPNRWSTRRGPFLAKAAAGILEASEAFLPIETSITEAAERTLEASLDELMRRPHDETHPFLYAVEGFLMRPREAAFAQRLPAIVAHFDALLEKSRLVGRVPETRSELGAARLDIVAQTIRAGLMLDIHRRDGKSNRRELDALAHSLAQCVSEDGSLPFSPDALPLQFNVWTAMFAEQALTFASRDARQIERLAESPLIV